ncbi:uncharacterized protein C8A04DRAFT_37147 [Dichotomopilus funicola]|uniref:Reverse transcriptase n=1 Tax=Dichotomopilus funicola TaxID=1934379 RepID=A0AAN6ZLJ2_9PEZI|nr:hypothetical protein C8A04DRAFT_37147 [Dichotomopilus funicola]
MASKGVLSETLASITAIKLEQLRQQRDGYETKKAALRQNVASNPDIVARARALLKGCDDLESVGLQKVYAFLSLDEFLDQAEYDPSITEPLLKKYEDEIHAHMDAQTNKYEFASLYGKLVEEWIASGNASATPSADGGAESAAAGREEMHQQRATWEELVFRPKETDGAAIKAYMDDVFSSKEAKRALTGLRERLEKFQEDWTSSTHFDEESLETVIRSMLRSDILTEEKRATLRDFQSNKVVLSEIADVLNMRMSTIADWTWGSPLIVEQRRNLNGRYRFYTDEDLLHSILVFYVGLKWASEFRTALTAFVDAEGVWKPDTKPMSKAEARRRRYFLNNQTVLHSHSVQKLRDEHFRSILFDQLPESFEALRGSKPGHVAVVQDLLHRLQAEIIMQTKLGNEITVIRSDFKWFGPSLPHSTIFAVLEYFGRDPLGAPARTRKRGTLSILFALDYAVNQQASGLRLYRLHDDMWLWGNSTTCAQAWDVLNTDKTGSVRIGPLNGKALTTISEGALPEGDVKWGFLKLDRATGRFRIDQDEVDKHIDELRLQLSACRSILDYIQAWNIYGHRFFINNFGKPANCYGRAHIDSMLSTFRHIQDKLFPGQSGGVGEYLKQKIAAQFDMPASSIPDGYLYWPSSLGGLGLMNPFVSVLLPRRDAPETPEKVVDEYLEGEELAYSLARNRFNESSGYNSDGSSVNSEASSYSSAAENNGLALPGGTRQEWRDSPEFLDLRGEPFMSMAEFSRYRERTDPKLGRAYEELTEEPHGGSVHMSKEVRATEEGDDAWKRLDNYERWVVQLFHKDMLARFGGLDVVDAGLLPTGLMSMVRESRFQWQV